MKIQTTGFDDLFILELFSFKDDRGEFVKTIHDKSYQDAGMNFQFTESFYSVSKKDVIRGMHFQYPPQDHAKLVYVIKGKIIDVILDLRKEQPTYGKCYTVELSEQNRKAVYMGNGFAHGFIATEDDSVVEYHTTTSQSKECEGGILWNSFGYIWPVENPIMSVRDQQFTSFDQFQSPF